MIERKRESAGRMTRKRANETEEEMIERKRENAGRMTRKRVNKTEERIIERKRVNNQRMSAKRNESSMDVVMKLSFPGQSWSSLCLYSLPSINVQRRCSKSESI